MDRPKIMDLQLGIENTMGAYTMTTRTVDSGTLFPPARLAPIEQLAIELYAVEDRMNARMDEILEELRTPWYAKLWRWSRRQVRNAIYLWRCADLWGRIQRRVQAVRRRDGIQDNPEDTDRRQ